VCPKGKPGLKEFNPDMAEVFWHWRLCCAMDNHPDDMWAKRFRRILDALKKTIDAKRLEQLREKRQEDLRRAKERFERT
jgi:hypothetical protein